MVARISLAGAMTSFEPEVCREGREHEKKQKVELEDHHCSFTATGPWLRTHPVPSFQRGSLSQVLAASPCRAHHQLFLGGTPPCMSLPRRELANMPPADGMFC